MTVIVRDVKSDSQTIHGSVQAAGEKISQLLQELGNDRYVIPLLPGVGLLTSEQLQSIWESAGLRGHHSFHRPQDR